jgi:hypothetical protein
VAGSAQKPPRYKLSGVATFYGNGTTAMRLPRGTTVIICGAGGCSSGWSATTARPPGSNRIVDLYTPDFFAICGCPIVVRHDERDRLGLLTPRQRRPGAKARQRNDREISRGTFDLTEPLVGPGQDQHPPAIRGSVVRGGQARRPSAIEKPASAGLSCSAGWSRSIDPSNGLTS